MNASSRFALVVSSLVAFALGCGTNTAEVDDVVGSKAAFTTCDPGTTVCATGCCPAPGVALEVSMGTTPLDYPTADGVFMCGSFGYPTRTIISAGDYPDDDTLTIITPTADVTGTFPCWFEHQQ